jgi:hypothetical protein
VKYKVEEIQLSLTSYLLLGDKVAEDHLERERERERERKMPFVIR